MNLSVGGKYWVLRKINNLSVPLCSQCLGLLDTHSDQNYCLVQQIQRGASATSSQSESETGVVINQLNISAYHLWTSLLAWTLLMFSYFSSCPVSGVSGVSHESFKSLGAGADIWTFEMSAGELFTDSWLWRILTNEESGLMLSNQSGEESSDRL